MLKWVVVKTYECEYDPTYIEACVLKAMAGTVAVATVTIQYGDENSANAERGTINNVNITGRTGKRYLSSTGYTWASNYEPVKETEQDIKQWVEDRWNKFLTDAGLVPA